MRSSQGNPFHGSLKVPLLSGTNSSTLEARRTGPGGRDRRVGSEPRLEGPHIFQLLDNQVKHSKTALYVLPEKRGSAKTHVLSFWFERCGSFFLGESSVEKKQKKIQNHNLISTEQPLMLERNGSPTCSEFLGPALKKLTYQQRIFVLLRKPSGLDHLTKFPLVSIFHPYSHPET